ncbi:hypothetical protein [Marinobacterium stanieri]|uniref:hypothetical protein n=1 Tax=Marinobacterium stanieri TaxID=49186 RepID=UPI000255A5FE|nr:hypothetical protein [Marinobacterium stanieri]
MENRECFKCGHVRPDTDTSVPEQCPNCGAYYAKVAAHRAKVEAQLKRNAEEAKAAAEERAAQLKRDQEKAEAAAEKQARKREAQWPKVLVKTYKGRQSRAAKSFQKEAGKLEVHGYEPTTELWETGRWNAFQILVGLMFAVFFLIIPLIGWMVTLFLVLYLLIARPPGRLTVTYKRGDFPDDT